MARGNSTSTFETAMLPHLDAAFNLARWLTRDPADAEDVVQEAYLRAIRFFDGFHGDNSRAWFLTIVRNTCYTWLRKNRPSEMVELDEDLLDVHTDDPETALQASLDLQLLARLIDDLPPGFREVVVLRDIEGLSYKEVAVVTDLPLGTVMSRLARARTRLQAGAAAGSGVLR